MKKTLTISAAAMAAAIALAGCSSPGTSPGTGSADTSSTPGTNHGGSATPSSPAASAEFNDADTTFAQMMIPHHAQAVEMSETMLAKDGIPAAVTDLATRIKAAQGPEIEKMTGWLESWGQPAHAPGDGHAGEGHAGHGDAGHGMSGMMGEEDMAALEAAQGTEAAKLFLTQMIAHHEGAVVMAKAETTDGKNPEAVQLSKDITSAQETEIQEMKDLLATL